MEKIDNIILKILKKKKLPEICKYNINKIWEDVTGDVISKVSKPEGVQDRVLVVIVKDPVWINQLNLLKQELLRRLNEVLDKDSLSDIKFRMGTIKTKKWKESKENHFNLDRIILSEEDLKFVEESLEPIKDTELKDIMRRVFIKAVKRSYLDEKKAEE